MLRRVRLAWLAAAATPLRFHTVETAPFHPRIHVLGNVGFGGRVHARLARFATRTIDAVAYDGRDVRREIADAMAARYDVAKTHVYDVGCGAGTTTRALVDAGFASVTGVDTSEEMLYEARRYVPEASFVCANAVGVGADEPDAVVVACMLLHEMPRSAHEAFVEARGWGETWIVDIHPNYAPSPSMLAGEPFLLDYLASVQDTLRAADATDIVRDRVGLWTLPCPAPGSETAKGDTPRVR